MTELLLKKYKEWPFAFCVFICQLGPLADTSRFAFLWFLSLHFAHSVCACVCDSYLSVIVFFLKPDHQIFLCFRLSQSLSQCSSQCVQITVDFSTIQLSTQCPSRDMLHGNWRMSRLDCKTQWSFSWQLGCTRFSYNRPKRFCSKVHRHQLVYLTKTSNLSGRLSPAETCFLSSKLQFLH